MFNLLKTTTTSWQERSSSWKTLSTIILWALYALALTVLYPITGSEITSLVLIPVIVTSWLWGMWWGIAASLLGIILNLVLATLFQIRDGSVSIALMVLLEPALPLALVLGGMVGQLKDMSKTLHSQHQKLTDHTDQLNYQAKHDALTGLLNRPAFLDRLHIELAHAKREKNLMAIMFLDLDHFKQVNDTYGHAAGDALLQEIAVRLNTSSREVDAIARLGGDEFAIVMSGIKERHHIETVASKILHSFKPPLSFKGRAIGLHASIGISIYPHDGQDADVLIERADRAMYQVKTNGKNDYSLYSSELN